MIRVKSFVFNNPDYNGLVHRTHRSKKNQVKNYWKKRLATKFKVLYAQKRDNRGWE